MLEQYEYDINYEEFLELSLDDDEIYYALLDVLPDDEDFLDKNRRLANELHYGSLPESEKVIYDEGKFHDQYYEESQERRGLSGFESESIFDWQLLPSEEYSESNKLMVKCEELELEVLFRNEIYNQLNEKYRSVKLLSSKKDDLIKKLKDTKKVISSGEQQSRANIHRKSPVKVEKQNIGDYKAKDGAYSELCGLIGLENVKQRVKLLISEVKVRKERQKRGLFVGEGRTYHMVFSGNPGTGKTIVARLLSKVLFDLGIVKEAKFIECDRAALVAEYVGHTALKTNEVIDSAIGGVLFIDEAYSLKGEGNDFGKEAIETLLKRMEDERGNLVIIMAGYTDEMQELIKTNPGLESRFTRTIAFEDYSISDLLLILKKMFEDNGFILTSDAEESVTYLISEIIDKKSDNFANAREVRNLFEQAVQRQENRLCNDYEDFDRIEDNTLQTVIGADFTGI